MPDPRGPSVPAYPGARFRCLVCRRFVIATERGVCPGCGRAPPVMVETRPRDARAWARARSDRRGRARRSRGGRSRLPWVVVVVALAALAWAALGWMQ